jgi:hypothetical protein
MVRFEMHGYCRSIAESRAVRAHKPVAGDYSSARFARGNALHAQVKFGALMVFVVLFHV